jgi:hypothetical protein
LNVLATHIPVSTGSTTTSAAYWAFTVPAGPGFEALLFTSQRAADFPEIADL